MMTIMFGHSVKFLFYIFLLAYAGFLLFDPQFWIIDDHLLLSTIQLGKHLFFVNTQNGRFEPLNTQEYYILSKFFSPTPTLYWGFNAVQLILFAFITYKIFRYITNNKNIIYLTLFFLLLSPGFTIAWSRFIVGERGAIFCLAVFIYCYFLFLEEEYLGVGLISLIFANFALYYKEPIFLALGSFSLFHLIFSWQKSSVKIKTLDIFILISSIVFALIYLNIHLNISINYNESHKMFYRNLNSFLSYSASDPVLLFYLLPFTVWRAYQVFIKKQLFYPVYDAMLIAATVYIAVFFKLNIHTQYYLLPAYIFAIPALLFFFTQPQSKLIAWRRWGILALAGFLLTTILPQGLSNLISHKYETINYNQMLDFIVNDINSKYSSQRATIFLDGLNRGSGVEFYSSLGEFLQYKGLKTQQFDLKSNLPVDNYLLFTTEGKKSASPYSVFQSERTEQISRGDYLLVMPYASKSFTQSYLDSLKPKYKLLFQTPRKYLTNIPSLIKTVKNSIKKYVFNKDSSSISEDFYVFNRK